MKRINIIYLFLMLAVFGSCLDEDPKYTTNSKVVYSDEQSAQMALTVRHCILQILKWYTVTNSQHKWL